MVMRALDIEIPPVPTFNLNAQNTFERKEMRALISYLQLIQQGANQFLAAISLFDLSQGTEYSDDWRVLAARAGALSLNEMDIGIKLACHTCDANSFASVIVNHEKLIAAQKYFSVSFPNAEKIRHVIAHHEFYNRTRKLDGGVKKYMDEQISLSATANLQSSISGSRWVSSWEGETVGYNLSKDSAQKVYNTCLQVFSAVY